MFTADVFLYLKPTFSVISLKYHVFSHIGSKAFIFNLFFIDYCFQRHFEILFLQLINDYLVNKYSIFFSFIHILGTSFLLFLLHLTVSSLPLRFCLGSRDAASLLISSTNIFHSSLPPIPCGPVC